MRKGSFVFFFMVLTASIAIPALAQERGRSNRHRRQWPSVVVRPYSYYQPYNYPSYQYYGGYCGGEYGRHLGFRIGNGYYTGLKFDLELVRPEERDVVKRGIIMIDGAEVSIVNRHDGFWNGVLFVPNGDHEVVVELEDGRVFQTQVVIYPGQIRRIYIRFPPKP